jgi:hypothetical protein
MSTATVEVDAGHDHRSIVETFPRITNHMLTEYQRSGRRRYRPWRWALLGVWNDRAQRWVPDPEFDEIERKFAVDEDRAERALNAALRVRRVHRDRGVPAALPWDDERPPMRYVTLREFADAMGWPWNGTDEQAVQMAVYYLANENPDDFRFRCPDCGTCESCLLLGEPCDRHAACDHTTAAWDQRLSDFGVTSTMLDAARTSVKGDAARKARQRFDARVRKHAGLVTPKVTRRPPTDSEGRPLFLPVEAVAMLRGEFNEGSADERGRRQMTDYERALFRAVFVDLDETYREIAERLTRECGANPPLTARKVEDDAASLWLHLENVYGPAISELKDDEPSEWTRSGQMHHNRGGAKVRNGHMLEWFTNPTYEAVCQRMVGDPYGPGWWG